MSAIPASIVLMQSILLRLLSVLALAIVPLRAADESRVAALQAADDGRVAATLSGDRAKLAAFFSDDLRYAHSNGVVDTKASYIESLAAGRLKYVAWKYTERNFSFPAPGIALMSGRAKIKVVKAGGDSEISLGFLGVWREERDGWRFLAWQSGKLP